MPAMRLSPRACAFPLHVQVVYFSFEGRLGKCDILPFSKLAQNLSCRIGAKHSIVHFDYLLTFILFKCPAHMTAKTNRQEKTFWNILKTSSKDGLFYSLKTVVNHLNHVLHM